MANTGNGGKVQERNGGQRMEEHSEYSAVVEKTSIRKTNSLTADQALEILQAAAAQCRKAGINITMRRWAGKRSPAVYFLLEGVDYRDGNLVLSKNGGKTSEISTGGGEAP